MIRNVTESQKRRVAGRQRFKCAASIPDYTCPLKGEPFDESGYEIDHIQELRDGGSNELTNLQALCISCHRVKTTRNTSVLSREKKPDLHICYHCEKRTADVFENDKWHCKEDCFRSCKGYSNDGCGPRSAPFREAEKIRVNLNDFAFKGKVPLGTVRTSGVRPDGVVWHSVTFPRK